MSSKVLSLSLKEYFKYFIYILYVRSSFWFTLGVREIFTLCMSQTDLTLKENVDGTIEVVIRGGGGGVGSRGGGVAKELAECVLIIAY